MQLKITKVEIENFRSVQDKITLNLKPGLFSIEGINYTETNSSNGTGKSTLIAALFWALTGSSLTNEVLADEVVNLKTNKNCKVSVYIESKEGEIKVTRTRKDTELGNNLLLEINGQDLSCHKILDTQDRINKLIKIPFSLLRNTIIMTSGMESAFSSLTPQQRIQTLESIRDYSIWENVRDIANNDIKQYTKEINENNLEISNIEGSINTYKKLIIDNQNNLAKLQEEFDNINFEEEINKINTQKTEYKNKISLKQAELDQKSNYSTTDTSSLTNRLNELIQESSELKLKIQTQKNEIEKNIQTLDFSKKDVVREITLLERWFKEDTCPMCNRKLDRTDEEINTKTTQLNNFKQQLSEIEVSITDLNTKLSDNTLEKEVNIELDKKRSEYREIESKISSIQAENNNKTSIITTIQSEILALERNISNLDLEINKIENKKASYTTNLETYKSNLKKYSDEIATNTDNITVIKNKNVELNSKKLLSDFYYKLLGSKGELRPYLLSKDISYLNNRMQFYISRFFKNTDVCLLLNNGSIDIKISADGVTKNISSLSGGEKKRVDISIQLALYDLIQSVSQVNFNLLCLDEIESLLDPIGCEQLIEIIEDKSENIETVWWITNNMSVKESIPNKILVKKILGKTQVEEM